MGIVYDAHDLKYFPSCCVLSSAIVLTPCNDAIDAKIPLKNQIAAVPFTEEYEACNAS